MLQKVTDPQKVVTDKLVLKRLAEQGIDKDYVEFWHNYAPRSKGKEYSPYAKFYKDLKSDKRIMVVSGLPKVKALGHKIEVGWLFAKDKYYSKANLFSAIVDGGQVKLTCLSDQPYGAKKFDRVIYQPQLFLNGAEISPIPDKPILLDVDPINENYHRNTLEWDYGICKRRVRIIEGRFRERWIFPQNPGGGVRIKHNQQGNYRLRLGVYKINDDEELVPAEAFINPEFGYPFEIRASATYYPDAHVETASVDGMVGYSSGSNGGDLVWADIRGHGGNIFRDDTPTADNPAWLQTTADQDYYKILYRSIYLFDTSGLGSGAVISAAVFSFYGSAKADTFGITPDLCVYSSDPASNTALADGDYDSLGATEYSSIVTYAAYSASGYNDFTLNATGRGIIDKTGITKLGIREHTHDAHNSEPTWASEKHYYFSGYMADKGTGFKPKLVVTYTVPILVTPATLALTLTTYAPSINVGRTVTPSTLALAITTYVPAIGITQHVKVTPTTLALILTKFAPTVSTPRLVTPSTLALLLTTYVPSIFYWKNLTQELFDAQREAFLNTLVRVTLSKTGETDVVLEQDRILRVPAQDESSNSQVAEIICDNSDGFFTAKDLKGWDAVLEWGLVTGEGNEYAARPPLKVLAQYESSAPGALICRLSFFGIPDRLALDKASTDWLGHWSDAKTVKDLITEIADGTAVATELTEQQTTTDSWFKLDAQTFGGVVFTDVHGAGKRFGFTGTINKLSFKLKKVGTPTATNVIFRVRDATSDDILASVNYPVSSITSGGGWCTATLATPLEIDLPLTFPKGVATGGIWIYCEDTDGTATDYIAVAYNSFGMKGNEWFMVIGSVSGPVEFTDLDLASKVYYADAGVNVFSHCEAYTVVYDSEDSLIDTYCPADSFKIKEGTSRLDAINTLLTYTTCAKRIGVDGKIHIRVPVTTGTTYDSQYSLASGHTFFSKSIREALVLPNKITVHSFPNDDNQYTGSATSATSYALLPVEDFIKTRLTSSDPQAIDLAGARIAQLERNAQRGSARVPMNLGSEIIDYILVTDQRQSDTRTGNIGFIRRSYIPGKKFDMIFAFGDVATRGAKGTKPSELIQLKPESVLADEANLTLGDLRPILELISDNFVDIWDGGVSEDGAEYDGINDLARNQAVLMQSIFTIFALLGYGENEDTTEKQILDNLLAYLTKEQTDAKITAALGSYLANIVEDTTPTLGGTLDVDSQEIENSLIDSDIMAYSKDTVYVNSGKTPILVVVSVECDNASQAVAYIGSSNPPTTAVAYTSIDLSNPGNTKTCLVFVVPVGKYYKVDEASATITITKWAEYGLGGTRGSGTP